jgi:hypothetical protein
VAAVTDNGRSAAADPRWRHGLGVDRMLELFALYNHDMPAAAGR